MSNQNSPAAGQNPVESELDCREIFLAHVAERAAPVGGDIGEASARREAVFIWIAR